MSFKIGDKVTTKYGNTGTVICTTKWGISNSYAIEMDGTGEIIRAGLEDLLTTFTSPDLTASKLAIEYAADWEKHEPTVNPSVVAIAYQDGYRAGRNSK